MGTRDENDRLDGVAPPAGYSIGEGRRMKEVLEAEAELLRSEGIDPEWPGFDDPAPTRTRPVDER